MNLHKRGAAKCKTQLYAFAKRSKTERSIKGEFGLTKEKKRKKTEFGFLIIINKDQGNFD